MINHRAHSTQSPLLWHLLFADVAWQILRGGGLEVVDLLVHTVVLTVAATLLMFERRGHGLPKVPMVLAGVVLLLGLIQLIPLPEGLFAQLAPVKARLGEAVTALYPTYSIDTRIALIPEFHFFNWMVVLNDVALLAIACAARPPRLRLIWGWMYGFALGMSGLMIISVANNNGAGWLNVYRGSFGGLENFNHFGTTMVVLMIFIGAHLLLVARAWRRDHRVNGADPEILGRYLMYLVIGLFTLAAAMVAFQQGFSRTAVFNLFIGGSTFALLSLFDMRQSGWKVLVPIGFCVLVLLLLPLGRNFSKFDKGLDPNGRFGLMRVGLEYVAERPILGTGLGSTEELLDPMVPKLPRDTTNFREFHNDAMQILLELGWPGFACLLIGLGWLALTLWKRRAGLSGDHRAFIHAVLCMWLVYGLHSLVSFPLRVNALRYLVIIVTAAALHTSNRGQRQAPFRKIGRVLLPVLILACAYWITQNNRALEPANRTSSEMRFASTYGRFYRLEFFRANRDMGDALMRIEEPRAMRRILATVRARLMEYQAEQPFNLKAINLMFMAEVLAARAGDPVYDPARYEAFKAKAEAIGQLGKDRNIQSRMSMLFLLTTYEPVLNEADKIRLAELRKPFELRMNRIRIRDGLLPEEP